MKTILSRLTLTVTTLFLFAVSPVFGNTSLNGAATYSDLGTEVFIASLHLTTPSRDTQEILGQSDASTMEVGMVNRMSKRRWVNMWMQSIAINNPRDKFESQADKLVELFDKFNGSMQPGDVFKVAYAPGKGTHFTLNSVNLLTVSSKAPFDLFLRSWLGAVPPSTEFRESVLGKSDYSALVARIDAIKPSAGRIASVKDWLITEEEKQERERLAQEKLENERLEKEKLAAMEQQKLDAEEAAKLAEEKAKAAELAQKAAEQEIQPLAAVVVDTDSDVSEAPEVIEEAFEEEEEEVTLSVESILAQQEYTTYVIRSIYKRITYPKSALRRQQEGTTRVSVTVDRNGEVIDKAVAEESGVAALDKEALKAIEKAGPFDAFPDVITDAAQEFIIPISFRLN